MSYKQLDLITHIEDAYAKVEKLTNKQLYDYVRFSANIPEALMNKLEPIGKDNVSN